jgi:alkylation response protein AidB-like acyl-CoA dehydrogenase
MAWSLCPMLTQGAIHALESHGSAELQELFLARLVAGEWTGTMNLTEPQAGSDLSLVRSLATPGDAGWTVTGQKIYITWGDHDMTDNVIHLVLARTPDAPPGVRGLSLFIVPKFKVAPDGTVGEANSVEVVSIEHKLGIHSSPTCVLNFKDAAGYLVGEIGDGLACMFTMMNSARLNVGLQGVAISERAYQAALAYAVDRQQGRAPGGTTTARIIEHADVRRMLLTIKAETEAMRALAYVALAELDRARHAEGPAQAAAAARVDLLTPIVKGWCTERSQVLTSIGVQVHGGMGYVEETGAAQYLRDARILTIYEGTTGIQASDLVGRKVLRDNGAALTAMLDDMQAVVEQLQAAGAEVASLASALEAAVAACRDALARLLEQHATDPHFAGAAGYHLLMLLGTTAGGWQTGRAALAALARRAEDPAEADFYAAKLATARVYAEQSLPMALAHARSIQAGSAALLEFTLEQFETA